MYGVYCPDYIQPMLYLHVCTYYLIHMIYYNTSKCTCPIVQVHAYICLPRLLHLLSLPSLLYLVFARLVFCMYLEYFPMAMLL